MIYWNFDYENRLHDGLPSTLDRSRIHPFACLEVLAALAYPEIPTHFLLQSNEAYCDSDIRPYWGRMLDLEKERFWNRKSSLSKLYPDSPFVQHPIELHKDLENQDVFIRPEWSSSGRGTRVAKLSEMIAKKSGQASVKAYPLLHVSRKLSFSYDVLSNDWYCSEESSEISYFKTALLFGHGERCTLEELTDWCRLPKQLRPFVSTLCERLKIECPEQDFSIDLIEARAPLGDETRWLVSEVNLRKTMTILGHRVKKLRAGATQTWRMCLQQGAPDFFADAHVALSPQWSIQFYDVVRR